MWDYANRVIRNTKPERLTVSAPGKAEWPKTNEDLAVGEKEPKGLAGHLGDGLVGANRRTTHRIVEVCGQSDGEFLQRLI